MIIRHNKLRKDKNLWSNNSIGNKIKYIKTDDEKAEGDFVVKEIKKLVGEDNVIIMDHPSLGVEDFAYFAEAVPSCFYSLGTSNKAKGIQSTLHENTFDIDEEAIKVGVCLQVLSTLNLLKS